MLWSLCKREAMDSILDLCEKGLNDGDYLTVSNNMKELYDSFAKKQLHNYTIQLGDLVLKRPGCVWRAQCRV